MAAIHQLLNTFLIFLLFEFQTVQCQTQVSQECSPKNGQNLTFTRTIPLGNNTKVFFKNTNLSDYENITLDCTWRLRAPPGAFIALEFNGVAFIGKSQNCVDNYLEVREGTSEKGHLYGQYCGNIFTPKPKMISSIGQDIFIKFHSAAKQRHPNDQFDISVAPVQFVTTCYWANLPQANLNIQLNKSSGVIAARTPGPFMTVKCAWRIMAPKGYVIKVKFLNMDIDTVGDEINIYEGLYQTAKSRILGPAQGKHLPNDAYSYSNHLLFSFKADYSYGNGFKAEYEFLKTESSGPCTRQYPFQTLGGMAGTFITPGFPRPYPNDTKCTWKITVPPSYHLKLSISHFSIRIDKGCGSGKLTLVEESSPVAGNATLGTFCSYYPEVIYIRGNILWAEFVSARIANPWSTGVRASYEAVRHAEERSCSPLNNATANNNNMLSDGSGTITSPNYPANYPTNTTCTWTITAPPGRKIKLMLKDMNFGSPLTCNKSYVQVRDGDTSSSAVKGEFCRTGQPDVYSSGRRMWLRFHSDKGATHKGFSVDYNIVYWCDSANSYDVNNDIRMTSSHGNFTSPNYPAAYSTVQCTWKITVPHGKIVRLRFTDFYIGSSFYNSCPEDYIMVRDGLEETSSMIKKVCGSSNPGSINSTGNRMWVRFSGIGYGLRGHFSAKYDAVEKTIPGLAGMIIGIVLMGGSVLVGIIFATFECVKKYRTSRASQPSVPQTQGDAGSPSSGGQHVDGAAAPRPAAPHTPSNSRAQLLENEEVPQ